MPASTAILGELDALLEEALTGKFRPKTSRTLVTPLAAVTPLSLSHGERRASSIRIPAVNFFFTMQAPKAVQSIEELLALNVPRTYWAPGDMKRIEDPMSLHFPHATAGIFRGQIHDWPLVPKSFRGSEEPLASLEESRHVKQYLLWGRATRDFDRFCERAELQNPNFPQAITDRLSIAQHFGVPTPLLDWSQNVLAAVFFAIRDIFSDRAFEDSGKVFIYHVLDERLFRKGLPSEMDLPTFGESAFVKPYHIDSEFYNYVAPLALAVRGVGPRRSSVDWWPRDGCQTRVSPHAIGSFA